MRDTEAAAQAEPAAKPSARLPSRFYQANPLEFVGPTFSGKFVYVGVKSREDFDKIALPCHDSGPGLTGHVLVKSLGSYGKRATVIFQHWIESLTIEGIRLNRLLDQRNELLNSFGHGAFSDGQIRQRIDEIENDIRALGAGELLATSSGEVA